MRQRNFTECVWSLVLCGTLNERFNVLQIVRCSFDIHVGDIIGTLIAGGTLVMLHPKGIMDFDYLSQIITSKQITYMHTVPTLLSSYFHFLQETHSTSAVKTLQSLCSGGV